METLAGAGMQSRVTKFVALSVLCVLTVQLFPNKIEGALAQTSQNDPSVSEQAVKNLFARQLARLTPMLEKDPLNHHLYFARGQAYFKLGKLENASADFTKCIEL